MATPELQFAAHPTTYRGTRFRSRLEARWAAFFDLLAWRWEYEPFDLYGWVPDFRIEQAANNPLLVEVKPFVRPTPAQFKPIRDKIRGAIAETEWDALLIGAYPFVDRGFFCCGWRTDLGSWMSAPFAGKKWEGYFLTTLHSPNGIMDQSGEAEEIRTLWAYASNSTQWGGKP